MRQTRVWGAALALVVGLAGVAGAQAPPPAARADKPSAKAAGYVHVVIFRLKKEAPADTVSGAIADCHAMLAKIESVRGLKAGRPAKQGTPEVRKQEYDMALVVVCDDFKGLEAYLKDPLHLKFVDKYAKHFNMERLDVFDFVDQKK